MNFTVFFFLENAKVEIANVLGTKVYSEFWKGKKFTGFFSFLQWSDLCLEFLKEASNFYRFPKRWRYFSWNRISLCLRLNQVDFKQINRNLFSTLKFWQNKSCFMVFFHEQYNATRGKNPQFNFSSQNLSVEFHKNALTAGVFVWVLKFIIFVNYYKV